MENTKIDSILEACGREIDAPEPIIEDKLAAAIAILETYLDATGMDKTLLNDIAEKLNPPKEEPEVLTLGGFGNNPVYLPIGTKRRLGSRRRFTA